MNGEIVSYVIALVVVMETEGNLGNPAYRAPIFSDGNNIPPPIHVLTDENIGNGIWFLKSKNRIYHHEYPYYT